jgi:hypothetical protein
LEPRGHADPSRKADSGGQTGKARGSEDESAVDSVIAAENDRARQAHGGWSHGLMDRITDRIGSE